MGGAWAAHPCARCSRSGAVSCDLDRHGGQDLDGSTGLPCTRASLTDKRPFVRPIHGISHARIGVAVTDGRRFKIGHFNNARGRAMESSTKSFSSRGQELADTATSKTNDLRSESPAMSRLKQSVLLRAVSLFGLIGFGLGCVAVPSDGYYDRDHHRYYHENSWHECADRDEHCHG